MTTITGVGGEENVEERNIYTLLTHIGIEIPSNFALRQKEVESIFDGISPLLSVKQYGVLSWYYGIHYYPIEFKKIAEASGLTEKKVCQIHNNATQELARCHSDSIWKILAEVERQKLIRQDRKFAILLEEFTKINHRLDNLEEHLRKVEDKLMRNSDSDNESGILSGELSQLSIRRLGISQRAITALLAEGIRSVEDLVQMTEKKVSIISNIGKRSLLEIKSALDNHGLQLKT